MAPMRLKIGRYGRRQNNEVLEHERTGRTNGQKDGQWAFDRRSVGLHLYLTDGDPSLGFVRFGLGLSGAIGNGNLEWPTELHRPTDDA
jgi:hypothetical protein